MGGIDNSVVDREDWNKEKIREHVAQACEGCGKHYFIPSLTMGAPGSVFPGVYDTVSEAVDEMSRKLF